MSKFRIWLSETKRKFVESPIGFLDEVKSPSIKGHSLTWGLKDNRIRWISLVIAALSGVAWIMFGFDATIHYFAYEHTWMRAFFGYTRNVGAGMHWSTIQLYALFFFAISYWLVGKYITGARNVLFSGCAMLFSVGFFEIVWSSLYDIIHFQSWTIWTFGDGTVIIRNVAWLLCLPLSYLVLRVGVPFKAKFRVDKILCLLLAITAISWAFWIYYPFPHVIYTGGGNVGSPLFPQTVYTMNILAEGGKSLDAIYFADDWVHATNIIVKYIVSLTCLYLFKVTIVEKKTGEEYEKWLIKATNQYREN